MSRERGYSAIRLEMPAEIPHTQYCSHHAFMSKVTGLPEGSPDLSRQAMEVLDYDFIWWTDRPQVEGRFSHMGLAFWNESQPGADTRHEAFSDIEEALNRMKRFLDKHRPA